MKKYFSWANSGQLMPHFLTFFEVPVKNVESSTKSMDSDGKKLMLLSPSPEMDPVALQPDLPSDPGKGTGGTRTIPLPLSFPIS